MSQAFLDALRQTLNYEGGYVHHPADAGGATNYGITQRTYDAYRKTVGREIRSVESIDDNEVSAIYHDNYWQPCGCDSLPAPLAAVVFDMAVHSGPWNAKLTLQRALGVRADGVIGEVTIRSAKATHGAVLRFLKGRAGVLAEIIQTKPSQSVFLHGWMSRILDQAAKGV